MPGPTGRLTSTDNGLPRPRRLHRSSTHKPTGQTVPLYYTQNTHHPALRTSCARESDTNTDPRFARNSDGNTLDGNTVLTDASGVVAALLRLAPAGAAHRPAPLRAALGRTLGLPLAALLRGRLPARGTSLRRHGSNDSELRVQHNCFELEPKWLRRLAFLLP